MSQHCILKYAITLQVTVYLYLIELRMILYSESRFSFQSVVNVKFFFFCLLENSKISKGIWQQAISKANRGFCSDRVYRFAGNKGIPVSKQSKALFCTQSKYSSMEAVWITDTGNTSITWSMQDIEQTSNSGYTLWIKTHDRKQLLHVIGFVWIFIVDLIVYRSQRTWTGVLIMT